MAQSTDSFVKLLDNYDNNSCQKAFEEHEAKAKALTSAQLSSSNVPTDISICLELGAQLHNQTVDKSKELESLPRIKKGDVLKILSLRLALWQAEVNVILSNAEGRKAQAIQTAIKLRIERARFFGAINYVWPDDPEMQEKLAELKKNSGYADLAIDGQALAQTFRQRKEQVKEYLQEGKLEEHLSHIDKLSQSLQDLRASKGDQNIREKAEDMRDRMYTLYQELYDEVARGGRYLFGGQSEEQSKDYAPLYTSYLRRLRAQKEGSK